ncbi:hypothetical protein B0T19DRAFT_478686 [Cercophora scortea]|uniref:Uncharacterized protein n=1 Tax=Cercophora scortea TaxID=314031 RepID=A0AAE0M4X7_9PEZI|nr:hypothetical protein B0T19DRAFT_478686 [Cercophora scortea]
MVFGPPCWTKEKDKTWQAFAKPGCRDSRYLWTDYWQRFNTIAIPMLDQDAFFADALAAAKEAQDRSHLEQLLEKKSKERRTELEDLISSMGTTAFLSCLPSKFPSQASRDATFKISSTGSLDSLIQAVSGIVWGWPDAEGAVRRDCPPPPEEEPYDYTGTQDAPSPGPGPVSDFWDLEENSLGWRVLELPDMPEERQLPPPTSPRVRDTTSEGERRNDGTGVGNNLLEPPRQGSPTASSEHQSAAPITAPRGAPAASQSTDETPTKPSSPDPPVIDDGPETTSGASLSLTASQSTPETPTDPSAGEGVDVPQQPLKQTSTSTPAACEGDHGDGSLDGMDGAFKAKRKRPLHERESTDSEDKRWIKRRRREAPQYCNIDMGPDNPIWKTGFQIFDAMGDYIERLEKCIAMNHFENNPSTAIVNRSLQSLRAAHTTLMDSSFNIMRFSPPPPPTALETLTNGKYTVTTAA